MNIRQLSDYLFFEMILKQADSEIEEQFANDTTIVKYLQKGEEIGVAIKQGNRIVKHWQILNDPSFGRVKAGPPYDIWKQNSEAVS